MKKILSILLLISASFAIKGASYANREITIKDFSPDGRMVLLNNGIIMDNPYLAKHVSDIKKIVPPFLFIYDNQGIAKGRIDYPYPSSSIFAPTSFLYIYDNEGIVKAGIKNIFVQRPKTSIPSASSPVSQGAASPATLEEFLEKQPRKPRSISIESCDSTKACSPEHMETGVMPRYSIIEGSHRDLKYMCDNYK